MDQDYEIIFYEDNKGHCPLDDFLDTLLPKVRAKIMKWLQMLERQGPNLPRPYADVLKGKIRELRIGFGSNHYRFLYFFYGKKIVVTQGFLKKTDQVPLKEIEQADQLRQDFLRRYQGGEIQ